MEAWRFIRSGNRSPAENMAIDEAILIAHSEQKVPPTVRFYGWDPATLSIGYFQKGEEEVDFEAIEENKVGFVRRPTGGRAVLHDQELTYSIVVSEEYPDMPKSVTEAYRVLSAGLLEGFRNLDLQAAMVSLGSEEEKAKYASAGSAACFDSPSWYELVVEGRKVAGSAQTRQKGVILQHGSILHEMDIELLFSLLKFPSDRIRDRMRQSFSQKAVSINQLLREVQKPAVTMTKVEKAFERGFAEGLHVQLEEQELTAYEQEWVHRLMEEKYNNKEWNFRR